MRRFLIISLVCVFGLIGAARANAEALQVQDTAPDRYVVVKGDTLWDIAGRFLKQAWRWPEIWRLNRDEIENPHWIYPGDVIVLDRSQTPPRLRLEGSAGASTGAMGALRAEDEGRVRLSPQVHIVAHGDAIPAIPQRDIQAYMGHPLVVEADQLAGAPKVIAFDGRRSLGSSGDLVFVSGDLTAGVRVFEIYHPGLPLVDPVTHETLAYRADYDGDAALEEAGEPARFTLLKGTTEVNLGDRLVVPGAGSPASFVPSAPAQAIEGHVLAVADGSSIAARNSVVIVSRGRRDGLQPGNVLASYPAGEDVMHLSADTVKLPQTRSGLLFVFRTFDRVSYALVVQSERPVNVLDNVRNP